MSLVSIVIATYNHAHFVVEAVESALGQTYPHIEVIVVDDGSTDNTRQVLSEYGDRIHYIYQVNKGPSAARNAGIQYARGDFFVFLDSDDRLPARKLEVQMPLFDDEACGVVYSAWTNIEEKTGEILDIVRPLSQDNILTGLLLRKIYFPPGVAIVRKQCLDTIGLFDVGLAGAADIELWMRIAATGYKFHYVNEPLFDYRIVRGSMSRNIQKQCKDEFTRLDKFFNTPGLPERIQTLRNEAYSVLHYEYSTRYYHAGDIEKAQYHLRQAIHTYPPLANDRDWLLGWIGGYLLGPDVADAHEIIDRIFMNLPPEAATLQELERATRASYHIARIYSDYRNHDLTMIRQHLLPAVLGKPSILLNKGFMRIAAEAILPG